MADDPKTKTPEADKAPKQPSPTAEQDSRVQQAKSEAEAKGGGPSKPESGLNQDG